MHMWVDEKGRNLYHKLPADHVLPKESNLGTGFRLWFRGRPAEHQYPYRSCKASDFRVPVKPEDGAGEEAVAAWKKARTQRKRFSKWRRTYGALEDLIKDLPCYKQQPKAGEELNTMFDEAIKRIGPLLPDPGKYKRRFQSLSQGTVYNDLVKKRKLDKAGAAAAGGQ